MKVGPPVFLLEKQESDVLTVCSFGFAVCFAQPLNPRSFKVTSDHHRSFL
jgi:hypothetical protein